MKLVKLIKKSVAVSKVSTYGVSDVTIDIKVYAMSNEKITSKTDVVEVAMTEYPYTLVITPLALKMYLTIERSDDDLYTDIDDWLSAGWRPSEIGKTPAVAGITTTKVYDVIKQYGELYNRVIKVLKIK